MTRKLQIAFVVLLAIIIGMGYYVVKLKRKAESLQASPEVHPLAPPSSNAKFTATVYVAHDDDLTLRQEQLQVPVHTDSVERAQETVHQLIAMYSAPNSPHPLGKGADIRALYMINNTAILDLNSAFVEGQRSGIMEEQMTIASLVQTIAAALPNVTKVQFLVDGQSHDTLAGHVAIKDVVDVGSVAQIARELQ